MTSKRTRHNGEGSIFPYRNGYAAYVWVDKPDGTRARKYVYGKTREIVHEKWLKLHQQAKAGPVSTKVPTLGTWLDYWLKEIIEPNRAPSTWENYEMFSRRYIKPALGSVRLDKLQVRTVQTWVNKIPTICQCCAQGKDAARKPVQQRCCAIGKCCMEHPSARTVKDIRNALRAALTHAVTQELISRNPAGRGVELPAARKAKRKAWTSEEARQFLESARREGDPLYAAYVMVLVLGMRKGEILGISEEEVNLDQAELTISFQLQRRRRQLMRRETKTETSDATLPLPAIVTTALKLRLESKQQYREEAGISWLGSRLIFTTQLGTPVEPRNFNRSWDARCKKAGVRKITPHDGRRTCGSLLADLDVHPRVAMAILRHAQFAITMEIYTQVSSKATREALKKLSDRLGGTEPKDGTSREDDEKSR
ncbi:site-specific integrase [Hamadaea sp. NPDC051192]|uniref:site-specific integrase n=1 Tax=Hamadaea sp. NPDC051192 TaxID=3154940 RepID=UPI00342B84D4